MPIRPFLLTTLIAPATAVGLYAFIINRRIASVKRSLITSSESIPDSFSSSHSVRAVVNPNHHVSLKDTRGLTITLSDQNASLSDEQVLARFLKGFFGGYVFAPEAFILQRLPFRSAYFSNLQRTTPSPPEIWSASQISSDVLPPKQTKLFGTFQILDMSFNDASAEQESTITRSESFIDVGYGSDKSSFSGVHRFSIERKTVRDFKHNAAAPTHEDITIRMSCMTCNPLKERRAAPEFLMTFHKIYAMLLFREAVSEVLK